MSMGFGLFGYRKNTYSDYINKTARRMATAKRLNSSADDSAMLSIADKIQATLNDCDNSMDTSVNMASLLKTAENGMDTITESLLQLRQLGLASQNGILNDANKALLQDEVDLLISHIDYIAATTQFSDKKLLDDEGTNDFHIASNISEKNADISIAAISSDSLGLADLDVTGYFDISIIERALIQVSATKALMGESVNNLRHTAAQPRQININQTGAFSRMLETNYIKEPGNFNTNRLLEQYNRFTVKNQMNGIGDSVNTRL